jgi:hypothetical protein
MAGKIIGRDEDEQRRRQPATEGTILDIRTDIRALYELLLKLQRDRAHHVKEWSFIALMTGVLLLFFYWWITSSKPTCRDGFTPSIALFDGWQCTPGYKP